MSRFIEGHDRSQVTLLPECWDDYIAQDNTVRLVDAFISELDMVALGFEGATPALTGRPSYHPAAMLKIYLYGYLNRIASSRRLERECQRNVELMWLTGRLPPDFKTIADFRRDNSTGIRNVCRRFVMLCHDLKLFSQALVAIDGSKFKAVNSRDCNFTNGKIDKRQQQIAALPECTGDSRSHAASRFGGQDSAPAGQDRPATPANARSGCCQARAQDTA
jgi:transposase